VRGTSQTDGKPELSEPTMRIRCGGRLTDKSYSRDNRLVPPKSSYRRRSSAPRCRLTLARGWRSSQAFGCSPIKKVRELGSDRIEAKFISLKCNLNPQRYNQKMNPDVKVGIPTHFKCRRDCYKCFSFKNYLE
jgi:hypothetical protein